MDGKLRKKDGPSAKKLEIWKRDRERLEKSTKHHPNTSTHNTLARLLLFLLAIVSDWILGEPVDCWKKSRA